MYRTRITRRRVSPAPLARTTLTAAILITAAAIVACGTATDTLTAVAGESTDLSALLGAGGELDRPGPGGPHGQGGPGGQGEPNGEHMPPPDPLMMALDTDDDGELSANEIAAAADSLLVLDLDADRALANKEIFPPPPLPDDFVDQIMQRDGDGDGFLSADELLDARAQLLFDEADTSGDGLLDEAELLDWFENNAPPAPGDDALAAEA
jgi:hypothetical protein